jgi:predicted RNase H-like nuclease
MACIMIDLEELRAKHVRRTRTGLVRELIINEIGDQMFNVTDLKHAIEALDKYRKKGISRYTILDCVYKMVKDGELKIVHKGKPRLYQLVKK